MVPTLSSFIPFNHAYFHGNELSNLRHVLEHGKVSGAGPFTKFCEEKLATIIGAPQVLLTTSCTDALEMAALLLDIKAGDEIILPSYTFVSTANAFVLHGAHPVFADICPDTLNIDAAHVENLISPHTRAIVVVHYAGVGCDMSRLLAIATAHGIPVIEDNAHGLFGSYQGRPLGSFGEIATLSFHETKNITCGEGGAIVLNNRSLIERAEILREKGTDRSRFFRGEVDKYSWVDVGSSFLPSDILAAILAAQLEIAEAIQSRRRDIWSFYAERLRTWAEEQHVRLPFVPKDCQQAYHMFYLIMPTPTDRTRFLAHMKSQDILSAFHYVPLHLSKIGRQFGGREGSCPVTECLADRLVRLPFFTGLSEPEWERIVQTVTDFRTRGH